MPFTISHCLSARSLSFYVRSAAPAVVATLCLFTAVAGCQSDKTENQTGEVTSVQIPESAGPAALQRASASRTNSGEGLTTVSLADASFGLPSASQVTVPGGWHVQGRMAVSHCTNLPSASWDAVAPDGQGEIHVLPTFGWRWGHVGQGSNGCIPLSGPLQAAEFLQKFAARVPGLHVIGAMPISNTFRRREENFTNSANSNNARLVRPLQARNLGDVAAVQTVDASGHEMRLRAWVQCRERSQGGDCFAKVDILRAPKGRLSALVALVDNHNLVQDRPTQEWMAAYSNHQQQVGRQQMDLLQHNADAGNQMLHKQYEDSSARLNAEHRAGMEELQRSTDSSMRNANNSMNARTTAASDWRDYAADQQTVSGANGTYKTSSQYSNVWSSPVGPALSEGRTFGSTDSTIDPNTATDNTWSKDAKVHGNGQPY